MTAEGEALATPAPLEVDAYDRGWRDGHITGQRAPLNVERELRAENERLRQAIRILQDNWPKTVPAPMDVAYAEKPAESTS